MCSALIEVIINVFSNVWLNFKITYSFEGNEIILKKSKEKIKFKNVDFNNSIIIVINEICMYIQISQ